MNSPNDMPIASARFTARFFKSSGIITVVRFMVFSSYIICIHNNGAITLCQATLKERKRGFEIGRVHRFRYRTRYFTNSGVIGTKKFVSQNYQRFKDVFMSKREKIPRRVAGLDGIYSLKRLAE
jgi:hypothetical protein